MPSKKDISRNDDDVVIVDNNVAAAVDASTAGADAAPASGTGDGAGDDDVDVDVSVGSGDDNVGLYAGPVVIPVATTGIIVVAFVVTFHIYSGWNCR